MKRSTGWFQRVLGAPGSEAPSAHEAVLEAELAESRAALGRQAAVALAALEQQAALQQALAQSALDHAALSAEQEAALRRADVAERELETRRVASVRFAHDRETVEARCIELAERCESLRRELHASDVTLQANAERIRATEHDALSVRAELLDLVAERNALRGELARLQQVAPGSADGSGEMQQDLVRLVCLSAGSLDAVVGEHAHLALEIAFSALPSALAAGFPDNVVGVADGAEWLRGHLLAQGLVQDCRVELENDHVHGKLSLAPDLASMPALALARWLAAYAIECLNRSAQCNFRLERVQGGPAEFEWFGLDRALATTRQGPSKS